MPTYYVKTGGSDVANGTSDATAWATLSKLSGFSFAPGDSILLRKGDTWRETLVVSTSGTVDNRITYGNYGSGALPKVSGANLVTGWTLVSGNVYRSAYGTLPTQVFVDSVRQTYTPAAGTAPALNQWNQTGGQLYINIGASPSGSSVEVSSRDECGSSSQKSYFIFDGIHFDKSALNGIHMIESTNHTYGITIRNCTVSDFYTRGIFHDWNASYGGHDFLIENNVVTNGGGVGISWSRRGDNGVIRNNTISYCCLMDINVTGHYDHEYTAGIGIFGGTSSPAEPAVGIFNMLVESNTIHHCGTAGQPDTNGYGIWMDTVLGACKVTKNKVYDCAGSGITVEYSSAGGEVSYNLIYRCGPATGGVVGGAFGLFISRATSAWSVYNNTIVGGATGICIADFSGTTGNPNNNLIKNNISVNASARKLRVEATGINNTIDYNCFGAASGSFIKWGASFYSTYAAFETAYGGNTHSIQSDPLFVSAGSDDYSLQSGSPCRNAGTFVNLTSDILGITVPQGAAPDIGAYEFYTAATAALVSIHEKNTFAESATDKTSSQVLFRKSDSSSLSISDPLIVPKSGTEYSYEKWLRLLVNGTFQQISNPRLYLDGASSFGSGIKLWVLRSGTYQSPAIPITSNDPPQRSGVPFTNAFLYTSASPLALDSINVGPYNSTGVPKYIGDYAIFVVEVEVGASQGITPQETIVFAWDEI